MRKLNFNVLLGTIDISCQHIFLLFWTHPLHSDAFFRSQRDINRHHCWLHFWKIQINSENFIFLHFWGRLGEIFQKWPYFWVFERFFFLKFWLKNYFFQAKTGFCNFYTNIYEYLDPDLKNLISGLSESVKKCAKSWKL